MGSIAALHQAVSVLDAPESPRHTTNAPPQHAVTHSAGLTDPQLANARQSFPNHWPR